MKLKYALLPLAFTVQGLLPAQSFDLIPLGIYGGGDESNLSAYLLGEHGKNEYISLDAGTLRAGINKAIENGIFEVSNKTVLQDYIKGYFISHGHLDHLSGLVINSPDDSAKPIYALPTTIAILRDKYFTNDAWSNFANEGEQPAIGKYTYRRVKEDDSFNIENTSLRGRIFRLSHVNPYSSSAVLIQNKENEAVLYLGDTGADRVEKSDRLQHLWKEVAPLYAAGKLKAILIEVSFENSRAETALFGHLTPKLLNEELQKLAKEAKRKNLSDLKIIVTHLKPGGNNISLIKQQLLGDNPLNVQYHFPVQGERILL